jgi:hypothetical protein
VKRSIAIGGSIAQKPGRGGHTWVFLQYLVGFRQLGWDVVFIDRLEPEMCRNEAGAPVSLAESWNVRYFCEVMHRYGFDGSYALLCDGGTSTVGLGRREIRERLAASEALINVMGFVTDEELLASAPARIFLDIDPGFGQMWQALGLHDLFGGYDAYVTIAERIGESDCSIPTCGLPWIATRQPIVLDEWTATPAADGRAPITSVATWRGAYAPIEYDGRTYGLRAHEFRKFATLPDLARRRFEVALDIGDADSKDVELLRGNGWALIEPREAAGDPWRYRDYIRASAAELMIAKGMYVQSRSGWFSDRSICYLASGKPVIAQDTGFSDTLPTGEGLLAFTTLEQAVDAAHAVGRDRARHAAAARRIAEDYFDSSKVLTALTQRLELC